MHDCEAEAAARFEDALDFANCATQIVYILERHERDDAVERAVRKRQRRRIGQVCLDLWFSALCGFQHRRGNVDANNVMTQGLQVTREATLAAAQVECLAARRWYRNQKEVAVKAPIAI